MSKKKDQISIDKTVFVLNIKGKKISLSLEEVKTLQSVINNKISVISSPYYPYLWGTGVVTNDVRFNPNLATDSTTTIFTSTGDIPVQSPISLDTKGE